MNTTNDSLVKKLQCSSARQPRQHQPFRSLFIVNQPHPRLLIGSNLVDRSGNTTSAEERSRGAAIHLEKRRKDFFWQHLFFVYLKFAMSSGSLPSLGLPSNLEEAQITSLPDSFYYIAEFITHEEERVLLDKVRTSKQSKVSPHHVVTLTILRLHRLQSRAGKYLDTAGCKHGLRT